uniref:E3 UFM1-protein ligase 1 n=1 Tax=Callorhinchus milii TaxID=7868 RepID=A0A4W3J0X2_CALMI
MDGDWDEIRRLAADFQRAQFASTMQRLSEQNCIEIVAKLTEAKQLDVVHTLDGKEYITPAQIAREIRDELYFHGGRINIVDLQQILNVDLMHIETKANDIAKMEKSIQLILGQLIDENYLDQMAEEVNDRLQEAGQITISELCKTYDLPVEFITEALSHRLGKIINGQLDCYDQGVIFTDAFVAQHKARIRGLFSAITRPIPVSTLITHYKFQERLLYSFLEELLTSGRLNGAVIGGRQDKAIYIPDIYSRTQNNWVDSFFKQNGYLEYDTLSRLGIPDPINYIKKRYKSTPLTYLKATCVGHVIVDQVEASVEEALRSDTWVDIQSLLPTSFSVEDASILLQQVMRTLNKLSNSMIFVDTFVVSEQFIRSCAALFEQIMQHKAEKEVQNNHAHVFTEEDLKQAAIIADSMISVKKDKRDERKKKSTEGTGSIRAGGGGNAREIRIRKSKKRGKKEEDSDEETPSIASSKNKQKEIRFMTQEEIEDVLKNRLEDCPEELITELAAHLIRPLSKSYQEVLHSVFLSTSTAGSGASRKKTVKELQEEVSNFYNNIRLFEKGAKLFTDDTQVQLAKHALKTICTDITNLIFNFLAGDLMMSVENYNTITPESTEEFFVVLDGAAEICGIMLKKGDKKKERQVIFQHRQALIEQLKITEDPALVLHLTSVLLFQLSTHNMLHAPGRCVPQLITFLLTKIPEDQHKVLVKYQGLVVKQLVGQKKGGQGDEESGDSHRVEGEGENEVELGRKELQELTPFIKDLVLKPRKTSVTEE